MYADAIYPEVEERCLSQIVDSCKLLYVAEVGVMRQHEFGVTCACAVIDAINVGAKSICLPPRFCSV